MQHKLLPLIESPTEHISLEINQEKESGCGLWGEIWAKFGTMF